MGNVINFLRCLSTLRCGCRHETEFVQAQNSRHIGGTWMTWVTWNGPMTLDHDAQAGQEEGEDDPLPGHAPFLDSPLPPAPSSPPWDSPWVM